MRTQVQNEPKQVSQKPGIQAERRKDKQPRKLALRFSPTAWAKLLYFRDKSDNEVSGFGIAEPEDLLCVKEFVTVKQEVTVVSIKLDDEAVADFFDQQVDLGRKPEQFARIWPHSHPGDCPEPSITDEETFVRVFGGCQWAVMFILAQGNRTYARLSFNVGPGGQMLIPVEVDYSRDFGPSDHEGWDAEYSANIVVENLTACCGSDKYTGVGKELDGLALPQDIIEEFENMEPAERQFILDELAARPELYGFDEEDMFL